MRNSLFKPALNSCPAANPSRCWWWKKRSRQFNFQSISKPRAIGRAQQTFVANRTRTGLARGRETQPYAALGAQLGMTQGATRVAVCRLRERYRECLKAEIAHTVASAAEVDEELRHLLRVMARR